VGAALAGIGARPGGPVGDALATTGGLLSRGAATGDVLAALLDACGPAVRPLVDALADHDRYGTPLGPVLDRVAIDSRLRRRRAAEEAARRLPVTLLFPLVLTTLPAFALLTIAPLLVGSFSSLSL
jgi:tight adherence protein C